ncbi:DUF2190 family protein [uncultured Sphingomonas sp.]|uniref:DUF2190 family protein n=1 Tax=uncultured Sphingomonas sp. TaxID=158754 RepID=UPI0037485284
MRNFIKGGENVNVTLPYAVAPGGGVQVGAALFGVAPQGGGQNAVAAIETVGVFALPKAAGLAIVAGDKLYWDNAAKVMTKTAAGNVYVAVAVRDAAAGDATVQARLNGVVI